MTTNYTSQNSLPMQGSCWVILFILFPRITYLLTQRPASYAHRIQACTIFHNTWLSTVRTTLPRYKDRNTHKNDRPLAVAPLQTCSTPPAGKCALCTYLVLGDIPAKHPSGVIGLPGNTSSLLGFLGGGAEYFTKNEDFY